jgi:hypothetical protein
MEGWVRVQGSAGMGIVVWKRMRPTIFVILCLSVLLVPGWGQQADAPATGALAQVPLEKLSDRTLTALGQRALALPVTWLHAETEGHIQGGGITGSVERWDSLAGDAVCDAQQRLDGAGANAAARDFASGV